MAELEFHYEGTVKPEEIDRLGHMNVRYYGVKVDRSAAGLLAARGLSPATIEAQGAVLLFPERHTHYRQEQREGAPVAVRSGILAAETEALVLYHELINAKTGALAATVTARAMLADAATRTPLRFPADFLSAARSGVVSWPEEGKPRSLPFGEPPRLLSREEALSKGAQLVEGREERVIHAEIADRHGFVRGETPITLPLLMGFDAWMGPRDPSFYDRPDGQRLAWANVETLHRILGNARVGDRMQTVAAELSLGRKTRHSRRWTYDLTTGALFGIADSLTVCFDLVARRTAEIPDDMRADAARTLAPALA